MSIVFFSKNQKNEDEVKFLLSFSSMGDFVPSLGKIKGVAIPYNQENKDWRKIKFAPKSIPELKKVTAFVNHESFNVMSMVGTSVFTDSKKSINFEMTLNLRDPDVVNKIIPLIEMGALEGVSVGARILKKKDEYDENGSYIGTIVLEAKINEISLVTFQAFEDAKIEASKKNKEFNMTEKEKIELAKQEQAKKDEAEKIKLAKEEQDKKDAEVKLQAEKDKKAADEKLKAEEAAKNKPEDITLQEQLTASQAEVTLLKSEKVNKEKKDAVDKLVRNGIVYNSQSERILKSFQSATDIEEFYKDIPASFSVDPKGAGTTDVTTDQIQLEKNKKIASELSSIDGDDIAKYNK